MPVRFNTQVPIATGPLKPVGPSLKSLRAKVTTPKLVFHPRYPEIEEALMLDVPLPQIIRTFSLPSFPIEEKQLAAYKRKMVRLRMEILQRKRVEVGAKLIDTIQEELEDGLREARSIPGAIGLEARSALLGRALTFHEQVMKAEIALTEQDLKKAQMRQQAALAQQGLGGGGGAAMVQVNFGASIAAPRAPRVATPGQEAQPGLAIQTIEVRMPETVDATASTETEDEDEDDEVEEIPWS